jgi:hypothetical protein
MLVTFTPLANGEGYDFTADTRFDKLFAGIVVARPDAEAGIRLGLDHITTGGHIQCGLWPFTGSCVYAKRLTNQR